MPVRYASWELSDAETVQAFEARAQNPKAWRNSAEDLLRAADAVQEKLPDTGDLMPSLASVRAMLQGLAIECLFKAMWTKAGNAIVKNGEYHGVDSGGDHELEQLADAVGFRCSGLERTLLQQVTCFVKFAGRYPIPKNWRQTVPVKGIAPTYLSKQDLDKIDKLAKRLLSHAWSWDHKRSPGKAQ